MLTVHSGSCLSCNLHLLLCFSSWNPFHIISIITIIAIITIMMMNVNKTIFCLFHIRCLYHEINGVACWLFGLLLIIIIWVYLSLQLVIQESPWSNLDLIFSTSIFASLFTFLIIFWLFTCLPLLDIINLFSVFTCFYCWCCYYYDCCCWYLLSVSYLLEYIAFSVIVVIQKSETLLLWPLPS